MHPQSQHYSDALRTMAFHMKKIGEAITKFAEASESLINHPHSPFTPSNTMPPTIPAFNTTKNTSNNPSPSSSQLKSHSNPSSPSHHLSYPFNSAPKKRRLHPSAAKREMADKKRIRLNWTHEENTRFFATITKYSHLDESALCKQQVLALNGSRNSIQCKGHFRNLMAAGRVVQKDQKWFVTDQNHANKSPLLKTTMEKKQSPPHLHDDQLPTGVVTDDDRDEDYGEPATPQHATEDVELPLTESRKSTENATNTDHHHNHNHDEGEQTFNRRRKSHSSAKSFASSTLKRSTELKTKFTPPKSNSSDIQLWNGRRVAPHV